MRMNNRSAQSGRSMVEMMGYMAVVMTVIAAVGHLIGNAYNEFKYSKASMQVSDLAAAIVRSATVDADYSEVVGNVRAVNDNGKAIIPKTFRIVGTTVYHAFGGTVEVAAMTGDASKFAIKFNRLNRKQCIELAMKDWQRNQTVDLYEIAVNNNYWFWSAYKNLETTDNTLPVKRSAVAGTGAGNSGQCNASNNSIMWVFN